MEISKDQARIILKLADVAFGEGLRIPGDALLFIKMKRKWPDLFGDYEYMPKLNEIISDPDALDDVLVSEHIHDIRYYYRKGDCVYYRCIDCRFKKDRDQWTEEEEQAFIEYEERYGKPLLPGRK